MQVAKKYPEVVLGKKSLGSAIVGRAIRQNLALSLVDAEKSAKVIGVRWQYYRLRGMGHFDKPHVFLVDGSPTRPLRNISFLGSVVIQEKPGVERLQIAASNAMLQLLARARQYRRSGEYEASFSIELWNNDSFVKVIGLPDLSKLTQIAENTEFNKVLIRNFAPYAGKQERHNRPDGIFYYVWKKMTKRMPDIGFHHYYDYGPYKNKTVSHPNMIPVMVIGELDVVLSKVNTKPNDFLKKRRRDGRRALRNG